MSIETLMDIFHKIRLWTWKLDLEEDPGHGGHRTHSNMFFQETHDIDVLSIYP